MAAAPDPATPAPEPGVPGLPRPAKLTGRAALLAVVMCVISLSLAYPVREYIAQAQQIGALVTQEQTLAGQVKNLQAESAKLQQPWYVEQQARDQLHWCFPNEKCYQVIDGTSPFIAVAAQPKTVTSWYDRLWRSVQRADQNPAR
jgi:cell division protein FtsB